MTEMMDAWTYRSYGGPEVLTRTVEPVPRPGPGEVLIRVEASSINAADWYLVQGRPAVLRLTTGLRGPREPVPGLDGVGPVVALGEGVTRFKPGDVVFGDVGSSWARYATAKAEVLALAPPDQPRVETGGVPVAGLTAYQGLRHHGGVAEGARVLVHGASGGVGTFAVQVGVALGADVTAVCRSHHLDTVASLGPAEVIDSSDGDVMESLARRPGRFDVLFDVAGVHGAGPRARLLAPGGVCLLVGAPSGGRILGPITALVRSMAGAMVVRGRFRTFVAAADGDDTAALAALIEAGALRTVVDEVHGFDAVPEALAVFRSGPRTGKVCLDFTG